MNTRAPLALALAAGIPAAAPAQETFIVNYSWVEVTPGTISPVPIPNSVLEPGEAARIRVGVEARINGVSAIGQTTLFALGPNGVGTVKGLGSVVYDLVGDNNAASAHGVWGGFAGGLSGPIAGAPFTFGLSAGTPQLGGASVHGFGGAQFLLPGQSVHAGNSNVQAFRGVWRPTSYSLESVRFLARASILVPTGQQNSLLVAYGVGTDTGGGNKNYDLVSAKYIATDFGNGLTIPMIPSPSSLSLLGLGSLIAGCRRRAGVPV